MLYVVTPSFASNSTFFLFSSINVIAFAKSISSSCSLVIFIGCVPHAIYNPYGPILRTTFFLSYLPNNFGYKNNLTASFIVIVSIVRGSFIDAVIGVPLQSFSGYILIIGPYFPVEV